MSPAGARERTLALNLGRSSAVSKPPSAQVVQYRNRRSRWRSLSWRGSPPSWAPALRAAPRRVSSVVTWHMSRLTWGQGAPGMVFRHSSRTNSSTGATNLSKQGRRTVASPGRRCCSQDAARGFQPSSESDT